MNADESAREERTAPRAFDAAMAPAMMPTHVIASPQRSNVESKKAPSFDDDRNFQFRTYTAVLHKHFATDRVTFRVPYIRRALPGSPRGAWDVFEGGEFYSVTPKTEPGSIGLVKEVDIYPWSTEDPLDIPPEDFPDEEIPEEDYLKITYHPKKPDWEDLPDAPEEDLFPDDYLFPEEDLFPH